MKRTWQSELGTLASLVLFAALFGGMTWAQDDKEKVGTGLKTSPEEEAWIKKNWKEAGKPALNELGRLRVNKELRKKGLAPLPENAASVPAGSGTSETLTAFPPTVDNSTLPAFPPIRSQGGIGSCVAWATTYYQHTHMINLMTGGNAKSGDDTIIHSPKWTYNMINMGVDGGAYFSDAYNMLQKHGSCTWAEFPYDSSYLGWLFNNPLAWRNALTYRTESVQYISNVSGAGLDTLKQYLNNGEVVVFGTYILSWQYIAIKNNPNSTDDDAYVGKSVCHWMNGSSGGHAMTFVGYNDAIWTDVNNNNAIDNGELGALRVANSWGTGYGDGGFYWLSYDALRATSAVSGGPSAGRVQALQSNQGYRMVVKPNYTPLVTAEFTVNHAKRNQMNVTLGVSSTSATTPSTTWTPFALSYRGGAYGFDGFASAIDGTFVFDFTDITPSGGTLQRYHLGVYDSATGDAATLKAYKLTDVRNGSVEKVCTQTPKTADGSQTYAWVDYTFSDGNIAPVAAPSALPTSGTAPLTVTFDGTASSDSDGSIASYQWNFGDGGTASGGIVSHTYTAAGTFTAVLTVTDNRNAQGTASVLIDVAQDPNVISAPSGLAASVSGTTVTLRWTDNSNNETGFYLERGTTAKGKTTWARVATVGANVATFAQTVASGTYKYRVQAFSLATGRSSGYSNEVSATVGSTKGRK